MALEIRRANGTAALLAEYAALFRECFPAASHLDSRYLDWLYNQNPDGEVVGFDAWDGELLAAHYACVPATVFVDGAERPGLLSLNTATRPSHQGQGLFSRLAQATFEAAAGEGRYCVYGVANQNSTPGFLKRLAFTLVKPLDAKVGFGPLVVPPAAAPPQTSFHRVWGEKRLAWRIRNPANPVAYRGTGGGPARFAAKARGGLIGAWAELPGAGDLPGLPAGGPTGYPIRLHLGLLPATLRYGATYFDIPSRWRPSPLNLIYRGLQQDAPPPAAEGVFLTFLDFDAF